MRAMSNDSFGFIDENVPRDFSEKELCDIKEILLNLEKVIDEIEIRENDELTTFDGTYIFEILGKAGVRYIYTNHWENIVKFQSTF